jgi:hypothetical protein
MQIQGVHLGWKGASGRSRVLQTLDDWIQVGFLVVECGHEDLHYDVPTQFGLETAATDGKHPGFTFPQLIFDDSAIR